jgi:hypothetical protein
VASSPSSFYYCHVIDQLYPLSPAPQHVAVGALAGCSEEQKALVNQVGVITRKNQALSRQCMEIELIGKCNERS